MKIAIYGPMCSGKTTVAKIIQSYNDEYQIYSFGQKIKDLALELFDMKDKNRSLLIAIGSKMREINPDLFDQKFVLN